MFPFIRDGDVISLAPIAGKHPHVGEVVAFIPPNSKRLIVHRIVACRKGACFIQGDHCSKFPDGWIAENTIIGRVIRIEHAGRIQRLGIGPEAVLIALLSRLAFLWFMVKLAVWIRKGIEKVTI